MSLTSPERNNPMCVADRLRTRLREIQQTRYEIECADDFAFTRGRIKPLYDEERGIRNALSDLEDTSVGHLVDLEGGV